MLSMSANLVRQYVTFPTPAYTYALSCITWLTYPLSYNLIGSIISTSSCKSCLSNQHIFTTKSITLSPPSLALSLKILPISSLSIRGIMPFSSIYYLLSLMPPSLTSIYYAILVTLILSISEIMPSYSCYVKKGLVYIIITALFSH